MIVVGVVNRSLTADFAEIHKKTQFSVGSPLCKFGTCVFGEREYHDDSIFVHQS